METKFFSIDILNNYIKCALDNPTPYINGLLLTEEGSRKTIKNIKDLIDTTFDEVQRFISKNTDSPYIFNSELFQRLSQLTIENMSLFNQAECFGIIMDICKMENQDQIMKTYHIIKFKYRDPDIMVSISSDMIDFIYKFYFEYLIEGLMDCAIG